MAIPQNKRLIILEYSRTSTQLYVMKAKKIIIEHSWTLFNLKYFNFFKNIALESPPKIPKIVLIKNIQIKFPKIIQGVEGVNSLFEKF